ncbi:3-oxoacyl-[acyl-carrier-protein] reductase [bacterium]|nr:3-oxoacyl-[acyl-carrier-protein] reductase [bacterium]
MGKLDGKVAWVTGSGRGIGRAIAERLAKEGAALAIHDVVESAAHETAGAMKQAGYKAEAFVSDVSNAGAVEETVAGIQEKLGSLDILVNNAGVTRDTLIMRMKEEDWDLVLRINLKGAFLCTKAVTRPMMKARWGRIVNVASVVGVMGNAGQANYAASKAGLIGLTKSAAKELAPRGITVNAIAPGYIETDMTSVLPEAVREEFLKLTPLNRAGTPEDVSGTVAFLAGPDAEFITGQVLHIDGGMVM